MKEPSENASPPPLKKPSWLSQLVPYLFTSLILVWVFTGMSSNVLEDPYALKGKEWSELKHRGVKPATLKATTPDGAVTYCGPVEMARQSDGDAESACPPGGDFEYRDETRARPPAIRRTADSRIPDGGAVSLSYVKKVKMNEMAALIRAADLRIFLPIMILHIIVFFLADVFSFGLTYRWFNLPDFSIREMMVVRAAPYVIQIGLAPMAEVLFPLYMWRVKKMPVTETLSSNLWNVLLDTSALFTVITLAVCYNLFVDNLIPAIGPGWLAACGVFWFLFLGNLIFWHSPLEARAAAWIASGKEGHADKTKFQQTLGNLLQLLRTFSLARWRHYLQVYLTRGALLGTSLLSNYFALRALGVEVPLPLALISIPIIVSAIFQPISVGGYGGPQLVAWFLIVKLGHVGTADQVIAYSLLWSTCFLLGRAVIGLVFIRAFWKRVFPQGFSLSG